MIKKRMLLYVVLFSIVILIISGVILANNDGSSNSQSNKSECTVEQIPIELLDKRLEEMITYTIAKQRPDGYFLIPASGIQTLTKNITDKGWIYKKYMKSGTNYIKVIPVDCKQKGNLFLVKVSTKYSGEDDTICKDDEIYLDDDNFSFFRCRNYVEALRKRMIY